MESFGEDLVGKSESAAKQVLLLGAGEAAQFRSVGKDENCGFVIGGNKFEPAFAQPPPTFGGGDRGRMLAEKRKPDGSDRRNHCRAYLPWVKHHKGGGLTARHDGGHARCSFGRDSIHNGGWLGFRRATPQMRHDEAREVGGARAADIGGPKIERGDERLANNLGRKDFGNAPKEGHAPGVAELVGQVAGGLLGRLATSREPSSPGSLNPAEGALTEIFLIPAVGCFLPDCLFRPGGGLRDRSAAGVEHRREADHDSGRVEELREFRAGERANATGAGKGNLEISEFR